MERWVRAETLPTMTHKWLKASIHAGLSVGYGPHKTLPTRPPRKSPTNRTHKVRYFSRTRSPRQLWAVVGGQFEMTHNDPQAPGRTPRGVGCVMLACSSQP